MRVKKGKKILMVDDSETFSIKMSNTLINGGYKVSFTKDEAELLCKIKNAPLDFDLLILDLQIPYIDVFGVLEWMKKNGRVGKPPVLVVAENHETSEVLLKLKSLGAAGLITQGVTPEHFFFRVNKIVCGRAYPRGGSRILTNIPVDYTSGDETHTGAILNINSTGAFINTSEHLKPEAPIKMKFSLPGESAVIETEGKVIWVSWLAGKKTPLNGIGVYFHKILQEDRDLIDSFMKRRGAL